MTKTDVVNALTRRISTTKFALKKHSPEILVVTGVVGVVTSAVMACKATTKVSAILEQAGEQIDTIHEVAADPKMADKYSETDSKKDLAIVYTQTGLKLVKLYGPSVLVGVASIGCILASNNILRKRNAALAAAYTLVDRGFKDYRGRVIDRFGKDLDRELLYNIKAEEVEETVVDENGEAKIVKTVVNTVDPNLTSPYAKFFDEYCTGWTKDADFNYVFLKQQQAEATKRLKAEKYLFLNDVYEMLGIPKTKLGQVVGWVYDEEHPIGDNFVDFGIYDLHNPEKRAFVNGHERSILLDFNVDGNVWELMP